MASPMLLFEPFMSSVDASFWYELCRKKLDQFRISEDAVPLSAFYPVGSQSELPARMALGLSSFEADSKPPQNHMSAPGQLINLNTMESFKSLDRKSLLTRLKNEIWDSIESGAVDENPSLLNKWVLTSFADLKKYKFTYWFGFVTITPPAEKSFRLINRTQLSSKYNADQVASLTQTTESVRVNNLPYFLVKKVDDKAVTIGDIKNFASFYGASDEPIFGVVTPVAASGWPLRNFLIYLKTKLKLSKATILQFRTDKSNTADISPSDIIEVDLLGDLELTKEECTASGWERTGDGKLAPRFLNLEGTMDPTKLAASAVDLNLKLMRWRLLPNLDLEKVSKTKCLLLGAGTLGCNVARNLLAWGVRKITFVDNGKVSYSNPVRQWLYTFEDSKEGRNKATAAAERLKLIFPEVETEGIEMTIPMPGHIVKGSDAVKECHETVAKLEKLIAEHDVVFLLLDSREARWLPTVMATSMGKLTMNTALGFDNYVVMRHGVPTPEGAQRKAESDDPLDQHHRLGCYFCNDVVAPQDSLNNRTLDQQCTVTRPGLSSIASAFAVELMVSVLHHPDREHAPAEQRQAEIGGPTSTELGIVPHQLRGFLGYFTNMIISGHFYDKCVACSDPVVQSYRQKGIDFIIEVCNYPQLLEDITGITEMKKESVDVDVEWDSENDDF